MQNLLQLQGVVLRLKCIVGDHATSRMFWEAEEGGLALIPGHSHFQVFTVQGDDKLEWKQPEIAQTLFIFPQPCATPPSHLLDEFEASVVLREEGEEHGNTPAQQHAGQCTITYI